MKISGCMYDTSNHYIMPTTVNTYLCGEYKVVYLPILHLLHVGLINCIIQTLENSVRLHQLEVSAVCIHVADSKKYGVCR